MPLWHFGWVLGKQPISWRTYDPGGLTGFLWLPHDCSEKTSFLEATHCSHDFRKCHYHILPIKTSTIWYCSKDPDEFMISYPEYRQCPAYRISAGDLPLKLDKYLHAHLSLHMFWFFLEKWHTYYAVKPIKNHPNSPASSTSSVL